MLHLKKTGLALSLIAITSPSIADELAPVIVTATRSAQSIVTTPSSINIITSEDIEKSGASQLTEILSSHASIQINDLYGTGNKATISMRGFAGNAKSNVQILVDGRRLNNPDLAAADLTGISLKDIKQIEIIQGSAGTLFGDQAVGGVINIITKDPSKHSSFVEVEAGSYNKRNVRASINSKIKNVSYRLSVEDLKSDNYREHNKQDYQNILARVDYKNKKSHLFIDYQLVNENIELPGSLTKTNFLADPRQVGSTPSDFNDSTTNISRIGLVTILDNRWNLETEITQRESDITGKSFGSDFTQDRKHEAITPRFIGSIPNQYGETLITLGADYNTYHYDYKLPAWSINTVAKEKTNAVYAQVVMPMSEKLTTTFGGRHAEVEYDITDATAFPSGKNLSDSVNVFEAGVSYKLSDASRLFARIDENFRFAKVDENTYISPSVDGLKTQKGRSFELGSEWKNAHSVINITGYFLKLDNEIDYDTGATKPVGGCCAGANVNLDPTTRTGLIVDLTHKFSKKLTLNTQYNYIDGSFSGGSFSGKIIPFVSEQNLTLNAKYKISENWLTYAEARYTSERFQAADYANSKDKLPALTLLNLQIQYKIENWLASLRINNFSNKKYASYATYDGYYSAPERNVMAKVKYNF